MRHPSSSVASACGVLATAYGVAVRDPSDFKDAFAFDDYDLWFGGDFNYFLDELFDDILEEIESDITSVDSTNLSEQRSK